MRRGPLFIRAALIFFNCRFVDFASSRYFRPSILEVGAEPRRLTIFSHFIERFSRRPSFSRWPRLSSAGLVTSRVYRVSSVLSRPCGCGSSIRSMASALQEVADAILAASRAMRRAAGRCFTRLLICSRCLRMHDKSPARPSATFEAGACMRWAFSMHGLIPSI